MTIGLFIWEQEGIQREFQIEVHDPYSEHNVEQTKASSGRASGPVWYNHSVTYLHSDHHHRKF